MAITEAFQNSHTISTTEYFLAANSTTPSYQATAGVYQLFLDLSAMANGDEFMVRVYEAAASAGTSRIAMEWTVSQAQTQPIWVTPSLILLHGWDFSIVKVGGTDRSIIWSIRQVA